MKTIDNYQLLIIKRGFIPLFCGKTRKAKVSLRRESFDEMGRELEVTASPVIRFIIT